MGRPHATAVEARRKLGRLGSFWSNEAPSVVWLVHGNDAVDKMVYAFSNPAASDLEVSIHDWPGIQKVAEVVFPFGTYRWRKFCGAICESTPASSFDIPTTEVLA